MEEVVGVVTKHLSWSFSTLVEYSSVFAFHWSPARERRAYESLPTAMKFDLFVFFHRSWWDRIWTAQEAAVAINLTYVYDDIEIPCDTIKKVAEWLLPSTILRIVVMRPQKICW